MVVENESARLSIGAFGKRAEVKVETIRYYERIGLLAEPARSDGGHRLYDQDALRSLKFIRRARALGFTIEEVRELVKMASGGYTCGDVRALALDHLETVRGRMAELRRTERALSGMAAQCDHLDAADCPVLDALLQS